MRNPFQDFSSMWRYTTIAFLLYLALCITLTAMVATGLESYILENTLAATIFALAIAAPVLFRTPGLILGVVLLLSGMISLILMSTQLKSQFYWLVVGCQAAALPGVVLLGVIDTRRRRALLSLKSAQDQLKIANQNLEIRVAERTVELERANSAKSGFLANVSHELRTPLNHIIGFTQLILGQSLGELNADQQEYLNDVVGSSKHLLELINEVLDISSVETGRMELEYGPIDPRALVEASVKIVADQADDQGITITTHHEGAPEMMDGDERRLRQVLLNLLTNAVKFTPVAGSISVYSGATGAGRDDHRSTWLVAVTDSGIGIKHDDLEVIFDPFIRSTGPALNGSKNTGLGLSISRRLIELHSGKLWAESKGPGEGSTFSFEIPL